MALRKRRAVEGAHHRFQQRITQVRSRPWRSALILAAVLAVLASVVYVVGFSTVLSVRSVEVTGVGESMEESVRENAAIPLGVPLAQVGTAEAEARITEDLRVGQADVGRSWPSTITIDVTKRDPAVAITGASDQVLVADRDGVIFDQVDRAPKDTVRFRADGQEPEQDLVKGVIAAIDALPQNLRDQLGELRVTSSAELRFSLGEEVTVQWGTATQPDLKARVLAALTENDEIDPSAQEGEEQGESDSGSEITIDLRAPETPTVRGLPEAPTEDSSSAD